MGTCSSLLNNINMYDWELLDAGLRAPLLLLLAPQPGGDVAAGGETGPLQAAHVCVQPRRQIAATRRFLRGRIQRATTRLWSLLHGGAWQHVVGVSWRGAGIHTSMAIHGGESLTVRRHGRQWASPTGTHRGSLLPPPRGT